MTPEPILDLAHLGHLVDPFPKFVRHRGNLLNFGKQLAACSARTSDRRYEGH
jgi:hypothetical protein